MRPMIPLPRMTGTTFHFHRHMPRKAMTPTAEANQLNGSFRCSKKRWQATRHVPAAHESHKLEHHDQWARFRFRKAKAVHHLTRLQPVKIFHSILGDVLQHGVSAAKRDDGCLAKEQTFPGKRIVPPTPKASEQNRQPPQREPNRADFDGARE